MDYGKICVVRDKTHRCCYITLHDNRNLCISDYGTIKEVEKIPPLDPPGTPLKEQRVFQIQPWPYTGCEIPPFPIEEQIERLVAAEIFSEKSA